MDLVEHCELQRVQFFRLLQEHAFEWQKKKLPTKKLVQ